MPISAKARYLRSESIIAVARNRPADNHDTNKLRIFHSPDAELMACWWGMVPMNAAHEVGGNIKIKGYGCEAAHFPTSPSQRAAE